MGAQRQPAWGRATESANTAPGPAWRSVVGVTRYVALLRGVNVGGVKVPSAELAAMARDLGLAEVRTVLASGNLLFSSDDDPAALDRKSTRLNSSHVKIS